VIKASRPTNLQIVKEEEEQEDLDKSALLLKDIDEKSNSSGDEESYSDIDEEESESDFGDQDEVEPEVPLENQEIVEIDITKIVNEQYLKICNSSVFKGFTPDDQYFDLKDKKTLKKANSKKVLKI